MKKALFTVGQTYSETSPESVEQGDFSDNGWEFELSGDFNLRDLIHEIKSQGVEHTEEWTDSIDLYGPWVVQSYRTGEEKQKCLHIKASPRVIKRLAAIIKKVS